MDDGTEIDKIPTLFIEGTVNDTAGNIIEGAKVEIWHANSLGNYSFFDKSQSDFNSTSHNFYVIKTANILHKQRCLLAMAVRLKAQHNLY